MIEELSVALLADRLLECCGVRSKCCGEERRGFIEEMDRDIAVDQRGRVILTATATAEGGPTSGRAGDAAYPDMARLVPMPHLYRDGLDA